MLRPTTPLALLAVGFLGWHPQETRRPARLPVAEQELRIGGVTLDPPGNGAPSVVLKEERMIVEYSAATNEAVVLMEAESEEALASVVVLGTDDASVLELRGTGGRRGLAVSGFVVETREMSPQELFTTYPEGTYTIQARSIDGRAALGSAELSHQLLPGPALLYPLGGTTNVPTDLTVGWIPDPLAIGYQLVLEQDENDGLTVRLPAGASSFQVPEGVLAPGKETHVEVGAIAPGGNITLAESFFTTG